MKLPLRLVICLQLLALLVLLHPMAQAQSNDTAPDASSPPASNSNITAPEETSPPASNSNDTVPDASSPTASNSNDTVPDASSPPASNSNDTAPDASPPPASNSNDTAPDASSPPASNSNDTVPDASSPPASNSNDTAPEETSPPASNSSVNTTAGGSSSSSNSSSNSSSTNSTAAPAPVRTLAPTKRGDIPRVTIALNLAGTPQQQAAAVNGLVALLIQQLGVSAVASTPGASATSPAPVPAPPTRAPTTAPSGSNITTTAPSPSPAGNDAASGSNITTTAPSPSPAGNDNIATDHNRSALVTPTRRRRLVTSLRAQPSFRRDLHYRFLQATGSLCSDTAARNTTTINLENYGNEALVEELLAGILNGTTPLGAETNGSTSAPLADSICGANTTLTMSPPPPPSTDTLDDNTAPAAGTEEEEGLSTGAKVAIGVCVPVGLLGAAFVILRRRAA